MLLLLPLVHRWGASALTPLDSKLLPAPTFLSYLQIEKLFYHIRRWIFSRYYLSLILSLLYVSQLISTI